MRTLDDIIKDIDNFEPVDDDWTKLDAVLVELWKTGNPFKGIKNMLNIFERFPEEDGGGVFWRIVHGLEEINGYEEHLINSLYKMPSHLGLTMLHRIEKTGQNKINGNKIQDIYLDLLKHPHLSDSIREDIVDYLR